MAGIEELENRYSRIPLDLKQQRRWVCFKIVERDGKRTKVPFNPHDGKGARSNDSSTWGDFSEAIDACARYNLDGLGFELGDGICGIDLDNHPDANGEMLPAEKFQELANEFVGKVNSYSEWSVSGNGIHILFYGKLPSGRRKTANVEMYDSVRFFAMTGNCIKRPRPMAQREAEVQELWKKYVDDSQALEERRRKAEETNRKYFEKHKGSTLVRNLGDDELLGKACSSPKSGAKFARLLRGDLSDFDGDHSRADQSFCNMLAFYSNRDAEQMDRIFRSSGLMREKWDSKRGDTTYGKIVLQNAIDDCTASYVTMERNDANQGVPLKPQSEKSPSESEGNPNDSLLDDETQTNEGMNLKPDGELIVRRGRNLKKKYDLTDTGNAELFHDLYGTHFHYNTDDKCFMLWTGEKWISDQGTIYVKKYALDMIRYLKERINEINEEISEYSDPSDPDSSEMVKTLIKKRDRELKNMERISNKAGKEAMISELQPLDGIPASNNDFNKDPYILNTKSGIVDLRTGKISPHDRNEMLSYSTNIEVSFDEPIEWKRFLGSIFQAKNGKEETTKEIVECFRRCLGYTLTGSTKEQCLFLLHGDGSNGKSTLMGVLQGIMGDYFGSVDSNQLMVQKTQNVALQYSLANLIGIRYLCTQETDSGARLSESTVKQLTGGDVINAQKKYGNPFQYKPIFKTWMMTNNLPIITGTDFGIWRRIFLFPFDRQFTDGEKDKDLPKKLEKEYPMILGWAIKGAVDYLADGNLKKPSYLNDKLNAYRNDMDTIAKFLSQCCQIMKGEEDTRMTPRKDLYKAYKNWAYDSNDYAMSESRFFTKLTTSSDKNFPIKMDPITGVMCYGGIILNENMTWTDKIQKPNKKANGNGIEKISPILGEDD